jgi:hypothetical protein
MWSEVRKLFTVDGAINLREILKTRASDSECANGPERLRVFKPTTEQDSRELLELLNNVVDLMEDREQEVSPAMIEFVEKINNKSIKNLDEFIDELEKPGSVMDTYLYYVIHEKFVAELDEVSESLRNKLALTLLTAIPRTFVAHKPQIEENNRYPLDEPYEVGKTHEPYVLAPAAKYEESVISSMKKKILEPMRRGEAPQAKRVEKEMAPWIARAILSDKTFFDQLVVGSVLERFANKSLGFWGSIGYTLFGNAVIDVLRSKQYYYQLRQVYFHMTGLKAMRASATEDERARLEADIQADKDKIERLITAGVKGNIDPLPDGEKPEP